MDNNKKSHLATVFTSDHIKFVKVSMDLIDDYLAMVNDTDSVGRFIGRSKQVSYEDEAKWVEKKLENKELIYSMVTMDEAFIGNIELMDATDKVAELGIAITKDMQDKGYGKEAIRRLIDYAFKEIKLDRLFLKVYKDNSRAIHVYQECGFKEYKHDDKDIYMELINIDKYRVNPVKVSKKKSHKKELSGEDIDLLRDNRNIKKNKSICDTHEDGA